MSKKTDFIKKFNEIYKKFNDISSKNVIDRTYEEEEFYNEHITVFSSIKQALMPKILNDNITEKEFIDLYKEQNMGEVSYYSTKVRSLYSESMKYADDNTKKTINAINKKSDISDKEKAKQFEKLIEETMPDKKADIFNAMKGSIKRRVYVNYKITPEIVENTINSLQDEEVEDVINDDTLFNTLSENMELKESHPFKDEIEELKINASEDDIEVLDEANQLLNMGDKDIVNKHGGAGGVVESIGNYLDKINADKFVNDLEKNGLDKNDFIHEGTNVDIKDVNISKKIEYLNKMNENDLVIDDNKAKDIATIIRDIDALENDNFNKLYSTRVELEKAIESKDLNRIKESTKKYSDIVKGYRNVFEKIDKLGDKKSFPCNVHLSRELTTPFFIRNQYRNASIFRAISKFNAISKMMNVPVEDLIKNPAKATTEILKFMQRNGEFSKKISDDLLYSVQASNGSLSDDKNTKHNDLIKTSIESNSAKYLTDAYVSLASLLPKEEKEKCMFVANEIKTFAAMSCCVEYSRLSSLLKPEDCIYLEDKDRTLNRFYDKEMVDLETMKPYPKGLNVDQYIKDGFTTPDAIANRIFKVSRGIDWSDNRNGILKNSLKTCSDTLIQNYSKDLDKNAINFLKQVSKGKVEKTNDKKVDFFMKRQQILDDIRNGKISENASKHIETLKEMEADYNGRSGFWKAFGSETKTLNSAKNDIKAALQTALGNKFDSLYSGKEELTTEELYKYETGEKEYIDDTELFEVEDLEFEQALENKDNNIKENDKDEIVNELQ